MKKPILVRITTVPMSLQYLLGGQLAYMKQQGYEVIAISADGAGREQVMHDNIPHHIIPFTRKITPIQDLICLLRLILLMLRIKPDIVHTHTPKAGLLGMLAAWLCQVPVRLHTVAGMPLMETSGLIRWMLMQTERITYACAHCVYPNSIGLLEFIQANLMRAHNKMKVLGKGSSNGIDTEFFKPTPALQLEAASIRKKYGVPATAIVFSFVGRIVRDKGIHELAGAYRIVKEKFPDAFLLVVGPLEQDLDPISDDELRFLQANPTVVLPGFQPDVRPWLLASDVFVFPSYREGFPNVVLQASALERACIVSDINGCNEIITHKKTGLLVPVKNTDALADAMILLAQNRELCSDYGKHAREFVVKHFEQREVWRLIKGEYERYLKSASS